MGFKRAFVPKKDIHKYKLPKEFTIIGVNNVDDVIKQAF